jgi:hypothetical protein
VVVSLVEPQPLTRERLVRAMKAAPEMCTSMIREWRRL